MRTPSSVLNLVVGAVVFTVLPLPAQWPQVKTRRVPLTPSGNPDLAAPAPKLADGTPDLLRQSMSKGQRLLLELKAPADQAQETLSQLPGVEKATIQKAVNSHVVLTVESQEADLREAVFNLAVEKRWAILQMTPETFSLEDVFRELTTK